MSCHHIEYIEIPDFHLFSHPLGIISTLNHLDSLERDKGDPSPKLGGKGSVKNCKQCGVFIDEVNFITKILIEWSEGSQR